MQINVCKQRKTTAARNLEKNSSKFPSPPKCMSQIDVELKVAMKAIAIEIKESLANEFKKPLR